MKQFFLLGTTLFLTLFLACGDDDDVNPIIFIGNVEGWMIQTVVSDYQAKADAAVASLTDEQLADAGLTRAEAAVIYDTRVARATAVDPCDQDDGLFFSADGATQLLKRSVVCPDDNRNVLDIFHARSYFLDADATDITFRDVNGANGDVYDLDELSATNLSFGKTRSVTDTLVGTIMYDIQYNLTAN